jgi:hypothetical protein
LTAVTLCPTRILPVAVACLCLVSLPALSAEPSAAEISRQARERGSLNLVGLQAELRLTTRGKDGREKVQVLRSAARTVQGRSASLARFLEPAGVAGVAVLTLAGEGGAPDEISIYLPKLKKVRRVAPGERGKSFQDTDFSYADLGSVGARERDVKKLGAEKVEGRDAWVLAGSAEEGSPYGQVKVWVDQQSSVPVRAEYGDKQGQPFKVYRVLKLRKFGARVLAAEAVMENLQAGSSTKVEILKLDETPLPEEAFSERGLERG